MRFDEYSYGRIAGIYDLLAALYSRGQIGASKRIGLDSIKSGDRVLYAGSGGGDEILLAARFGARVTAIDLAQSMLDRVSRKFEREGLLPELICGDVSSHKPIEPYDVVVANYFLNLFDVEHAREMTRHLCQLVRPGGKLFLTDFALPEGVARLGDGSARPITARSIGSPGHSASARSTRFSIMRNFSSRLDFESTPRGAFPFSRVRTPRTCRSWHNASNEPADSGRSRVAAYENPPQGLCSSHRKPNRLGPVLTHHSPDRSSGRFCRGVRRVATILVIEDSDGRRAVEELKIELEGGETIAVTISVGIASWNPGLDSTAPMIERADAALYRAKSSGRNRVCL